MKLQTALILLIGFLLSSTTQSQNPAYDSTLANKLQADKYGMKSYVFVILKSGNNKTTDKSFIDSCFAGHMKNINKLAASKDLVVAGPFGKNESGYRGLFVLNVKTFEEARALLQTDPAIHSELLTAELYPWYGSAALSEYLPFHDKIWMSKP